MDKLKILQAMDLIDGVMDELDTEIEAINFDIPNSGVKMTALDQIKDNLILASNSLLRTL
jgi:hypothetical protein